MPRRLVLALAATLLAGCAGQAPTAAPAGSTPATASGSLPSRVSTPSPTATTSPSSAASTPSPTATTSPSSPASATASATRSPSSNKPLAGRTIVVDPGHNGVWTKALNRKVPAGNGRTKACNTSGTAGGSYAEHTFNWQVAQTLTKRLKALGATVVLTRPNDRGSGPCVNVRARIAEKAKADAVISVHADGNTSSKARGYHLIISSTMLKASAERQSRTLAGQLRTQLDKTDMPRSTYIGGGTAIHSRNDIAGLNLIGRPGVMLELGNMRQAKDLALQRSSAFRTRVSDAIATALTRYFGR